MMIKITINRKRKRKRKRKTNSISDSIRLGDSSSLPRGNDNIISI
jgi:hypothetical protein